MNEKNYELLADAIVVQAAKDYRRTSSQAVRNDIKRFFLSDWFYELTSTDGKKLFERLEQERREKTARRKGGAKR